MIALTLLRFVVFSLATQRILIFSFYEILALDIGAGFALNAMYPIRKEQIIHRTLVGLRFFRFLCC